MTRIEMIADVVSTVALVGILYSSSSPWWAYPIMLACVMAQRQIGLRMGRREFIDKTLNSAIAVVRRRRAEEETK